MRNLRYLMGLYGGKATKGILKVMKRQGSYLPGVVSSKLDPSYLRHLPKPERIMAVTGTNGKTTTSNMMLHILGTLHDSVVNNSLGSNTIYGVVTALANNLSAGGQKISEVAVLEVDERWTPHVFKDVTPKVLLCTNLFQDFYRRSAHTDFIKDTIEAGLPKETRLVLNGDDLISAQIGEGTHERVFFSIAPLPGEQEERDCILRDIRYCPHCATELSWDFIRYHHIGRAHCPHCGFKNPEAKYRITKVGEETFTLEEDGVPREVPMIMNTMETLYNQLAAYATLREMDYTPEEILPAMADAKVIASRFDAVKAGDKTIYRISAKGMSPIANSRVLDLIRKHPGKKDRHHQ